MSDEGTPRQPFSCKFDDRGCNVSIGTVRDLGLHDSFTVTVWVKMLIPNISNQFDKAILGQNVAQEFNCLHLTIRECKPYMGFYANDTGSTHKLDVNEWYHLAFVYDRVEQRQSIYIDGQLSATSTDRMPLMNNTNQVFVSQYYFGRGFNGFMSGMHIYRRALSVGDINENMFVSMTGGFISAENVAGVMCDITPEELRRRVAHDATVPTPLIYIPGHLPLSRSPANNAEFGRMHGNPLFSDVLLTYNSNDNDQDAAWSLRAHKVVLYARSEFFRGMFEAKMREENAGVVQLQGNWSTRGLELFFSVLYCMDVGLTEAFDVHATMSQIVLLQEMLEIAQYFIAHEVFERVQHVILRDLQRAIALSTTSVDELEGLVNSLLAAAETCDAGVLLECLREVTFPRRDWRRRPQRTLQG
eukprot:gene23233-28219_t